MANNTGNQIIPDNTGKEYRTLKQGNVKAEMFANFYLAPDSKSFMNVRQSALRAGYSELYANNITVQRPKWWIELTETADFKRARMLNSAESALENTVTLTPENDTQEKLKHDAAKFISERLGKGFYSTRQEVTGADGKAIFSNEERDRVKMPITSLFKGVSPGK